MADNFGLKLGIEGEKEFKQALKEINANFKLLGSELTLVTSQFDKQDKSVEAITARNQVLNKEIAEQQNKIAVLSQALENASNSFGENDSRTRAWAIQLNNAKAELNNMERELDQNNKALEKASEGFDDAEKQADDFGDEVNKAGKEADESGKKFEKLGSVCKGAATALASAFAAISAAAVACGKALADMSVQGAAYADDVLTTSTQTGIATDKLQEYMYAAELVDVSTETLTKSMAKQIKSMKAVQDGTKLSVEAYDRLGVSVLNSDGTLRDSDTVYWEVIDALGKMTNESERDALAMQILGKSAQELNPLIEAGAGKMAELGAQAHEAGYVIGDDLLNAYGKLDDQLQYLNVGATAAKNALGTVLLPVLTDLAGDGVDLLGEFTNGILNANGDISAMAGVVGDVLPKALSAISEYVPVVLSLVGEVVGALASALVDNLPMIINSGTEIVFSLLQGLIAALPSVAESAVQLVLALVDGILINLPKLIEAAVQVVLTLANGIASALPELIPQIVQTVVVIVNTLLENIPLIIEAALNIVMALAEGIGTALPELIAAIPQILTSIVTALTEALPMLFPAALNIIMSLIEGIVTAIPELAAAIPQILTSIVTTLIGSLPKLLPAAIEIVFSLINGILGAIPDLIAAVPDIIMGLIQGIIDNLPTIILFAPEIILSLISGLINAIPDLVASIPTIIMAIVDTFRQYDWASMGKNIITGLVNGIGTMVSRVVAKIKEVGQSLINAFKSLFGINSPSTVFAGFGKNLLEGLWNGIANIKDWLVKKIKSLGSVITEALKTVLGIHSPSTVFENEIGVNLGLGVGVGFEKSMKKVAKDMQEAIPTDFDISSNVNAAVNTNAGFGNISLTLHIDNFNNNSLQDIRSIAEEISTVLATQVNRKAEAF